MMERKTKAELLNRKKGKQKEHKKKEKKMVKESESGLHKAQALHKYHQLMLLLFSGPCPLVQTFRL